MDKQTLEGPLAIGGQSVLERNPLTAGALGAAGISTPALQPGQRTCWPAWLEST